jgi:mRNA interferase RelE/StbE
MVYRIVITKQAKRDIDNLESIVRERLGKKLLQVTKLNDIRPAVRQLVDSRIGEYRLRIGDYRVLFDLEGRDIVILRVQHRKDVYR